MSPPASNERDYFYERMIVSGDWDDVWPSICVNFAIRAQRP